MNKIMLANINLKNFKGKNLKISFAKDTKIFGDNETGKTTIVDAFMWLMFSKDSQNRADFDIKNLDENNNVIHGLEHEVEGILNINNTELKLRKIYKENWTKKRGEAERTLTGHTTDHYINDVPVKKKEYDDHINSIVDESIFKLITNVLYFNTQLDWKKRRELLIEICGDITDETVINSNIKLNTLKELLTDCTLEQLRDKIKGQKSRLNKSIKEIPVRIDELNNTVKEQPETGGIPELNNNINIIKGQIDELNAEIIELSDSQKSVNSKAIDISNLRMKINDLKNSAKSDVAKEYNSLNQELENTNNNKFEQLSKISRLKTKLTDLEEKLEAREKNKQELYSEFDAINEQKFGMSDTESHCDRCGQRLPIENIQVIKTNFENNKNAKLNKIKSIGVNNNKMIEQLKIEIKSTKELINIHELKKDEYSKLALKVESELKIEKVKIESFDISSYSNDEIETLQKEVNALEKVFANPDETLKLDLKLKMDKKKIKEELLQEQQQKLTAINNKVDIYQCNIDRINELKKEEKELASKIAELEGQEFATEEFIRTKVNLFESKINSKFKYAKFKLFDTLVNGALEETCQCIYKGVPFQSLNSAAKIIVGLDIIDVLSEHYKISAPVFIDNAEGITTPQHADSQTTAFYAWKKVWDIPNYIDGKIIRMEDLR